MEGLEQKTWEERKKKHIARRRRDKEDERKKRRDGGEGKGEEKTRSDEKTLQKLKVKTIGRRREENRIMKRRGEVKETKIRVCRDAPASSDTDYEFIDEAFSSFYCCSLLKSKAQGKKTVCMSTGKNSCSLLCLCLIYNYITFIKLKSRR